MRALVGWVLAFSLIASPALAAGNGEADSTGAATSNSATSTAKDNPGSTPSAAAKADTASLESEISDLRDLIDSQANQLGKQNDQLQQEQKKLEMLEEQLKASSTSPTDSPATPAPAASVTRSAPASTPVATASVAMPSVPAASPSSSSSSNPSSSGSGQTEQGKINEPTGPLYIQIGSARFTPLGFMDLTNVFRSPVIGSGIGTNFGAVPYRIAGNFPASGLTEDRFSAQNSRIGFRVDAPVAGGQATGYLEMDFLGNAAGTISVTSNSVTLRLRVYFIDYRRGKWEVLGGQDWSMLTPNRVGISPYPADIFNSQDMDTNYQVGLVWERTPQFRFIYHPAKDAAFGISLENAEQYLGGGNGAGNTVVTPSGFVLTGGGAQQFDNGGSSNGTNIANVMPDIVVKAAFDPMVNGRDFHFEASGLLNEFQANTFIASTATPNNGGTSLKSHATGGGVSANINLETFKNFHLIANSYWSDGGGQKIFGLAPDAVIEPQANATSPFTISPLHSGSGIAGAEYQMIPKLMLYGYYGGVYVSRDYLACGSTECGYGIPTTTLTTAEGQNRVVQEGTIGLIPVFWRSPNYGALQLITQYSYLSRNPWVWVPGSPKVAHASMAYVDLRYILP